jgi:PAS domain S-box-containing protein
MSAVPRKGNAGQGFEEAKLLPFLDDIPVRVAFIDRDRRHLYANREYAEAIGMPAEEFIGKTVADIFGEESYEKLKPFGDRALAGENLEREGWVHHPRLGDRYAMRVYRPYVRPDGTIEGYFVLIRDRTDERLRQEALDRERRRLLDAVESFSEGFALWTRRIVSSCAIRGTANCTRPPFGKTCSRASVTGTTWWRCCAAAPPRCALKTPKTGCESGLFSGKTRDRHMTSHATMDTGSA